LNQIGYVELRDTTIIVNEVTTNNNELKQTNSLLSEKFNKYLSHLCYIGFDNEGYSV